MKYIVQGSSGKTKEVRLTQNDFIASGGQGSIFGRGDTVYKIYHDPKTMIPVAKITELQRITDRHVVKPEDVVLDEKGKPVGFTLPWIKDTDPLCRLFTKAFKQREGVSVDQLTAMMQQMRDTVAHVHSQDILIVDMNEMNFLAAHSFKEAFFIDVDSYQTPSFPALAIMESVRDRQNGIKPFSELTDWFSFAVITFQLLIGIHPFKGKHPKVVYADGEQTLNARMLSNLSVFNADVTVPAVCAPFDTIPKAYRNWYYRLFEKGERLPPPVNVFDDVQAIVLQKLTPAETAVFKIKDFFTSDGEDVTGFYSHHLSWAALTEERAYLHTGEKIDLLHRCKTDLVFTSTKSQPIFVHSANGRFTLISARDYKTILSGDATKVEVYDNRVFYLCGNEVHEVNFFDSGVSILPQTRVSAQVLGQATQLFSGVAVQDLLGTYYVSIFSEPKVAHQKELKALIGYTVVEAKYESQVLMVVAAKQGKYHRFVYRFSPSFEEFDLKTYSIDYQALNFTVLASGAALCLNEEDKLELFSAKHDSTQMKNLEDTRVQDVKLSHFGVAALFVDKNKVKTFSLN